VTKKAPGRRRADFGLTAAQQKVAMLAVRGRSNTNIAKQLRISVRTVANHMAAILAKTGVASRFELARKLSG
jgi:DNA-binding CsgD family transcriptional regulator